MLPFHLTDLTIGFQSAVYSFEEDEVSTAQVVIEVSAGILGPGIPAMVSVTAEDGTAISEGLEKDL